MGLCLDASALVKRYVVEPGTERVLLKLQEADDVVFSVLALPEVISALNRRRREGRLSLTDYVACKRQLRADAQNATVVDLSPEIVGRAISCLERFPLRGSDAVHVATALEAKPGLFLSGDERQCTAAKTMGLNVELVG
jgi:hypothetical protein